MLTASKVQGAIRTAKNFSEELKEAKASGKLSDKVLEENNKIRKELSEKLQEEIGETKEDEKKKTKELTTEAQIKLAILGGKDFTLVDDTGTRGGGRLYLRIRSTTTGPSAHWILQWFQQGKKVRMTLGPATGKTALTLKEARDKFNEQSKLIQQGLDPREVKKEQEQEREQAKAQEMTLEAFWPSFLEQSKTRKKESSWTKELQHWNNWIKPSLGKKAMKDITLEDWEALAQKLHSAKLTKRSQEYILGTLRRILKLAYKRGKIQVPPPSGADIGVTLKPGENRRTRTLTPDELQKILNELKGLNFPVYRLALFCAYTGCRFSEAATLTLGQVDLPGGQVHFHSTKNGEPRSVPLASRVKEELEAMGPGHAGQLVFTREDGSAFTLPPEAFRTVTKRLGLNEGRAKRDRITFHSLRHSAATLWAQAGLPLRDLMDLGGWKTASMALRYQHSNGEAKKRAVNALEDTLNP
jgi:integrase